MRVAVKQGGTDAGGALVFFRIKLVGLAEGCEYLLADGFRLCRSFNGSLTQVFQHHYELITAQTGHSVIVSHTGGQTLRDLLQQQVSNVMAERVIEGFEIVQVNEQQRTCSANTRTGSQCMVEPIHEKPPVGQLSERVVERQKVNLFFC